MPLSQKNAVQLTELIMTYLGVPTTLFHSLVDNWNLGNTIVEDLKPTKKQKFISSLNDTIQKSIEHESYESKRVYEMLQETFSEHFKILGFLENFGDTDAYCNELEKKFFPETDRATDDTYPLYHKALMEILTRLHNNLELLGVVGDTDIAILKKVWSCESLLNELEESIRSTLNYGGSLAEIIDNANAEFPKDDMINILNYRNPKIKLHGREEQLEALETFARRTSEHSPKQISYWAITGQGGVGKSKLAREFAKRMKRTMEMGVVWLDEKIIDHINNLTNYTTVLYPKPILFICDYAASKKEKLEQLIQNMANTPYTVRFLFIERASKFYDKLRSVDEISSYCYKDKTLDLSEIEMQDADYEAIIEDLRDAAYPCYHFYPLDKKKIIEYCKNGFSKKKGTKRMANVRCLFLLIAASAYMENQGRLENWNEKSLVKYYIDRNKKQFTQKYDQITNGNGELLMEDGYLLMAIATAVNGLDLNETYGESITELMKSFKHHLRKKSKICEAVGQLTEQNVTELAFPPLYPDIVGELVFCLEYLELAEDDLRKEINEMLLNNKFFKDEFIIRCMADWPEIGPDVLEEMVKVELTDDMGFI